MAAPTTATKPSRQGLLLTTRQPLWLVQKVRDVARSRNLSIAKVVRDACVLWLETEGMRVPSAVKNAPFLSTSKE